MAFVVRSCCSWWGLPRFVSPLWRQRGSCLALPSWNSVEGGRHEPNTRLAHQYQHRRRHITSAFRMMCCA